MAVYLDDDVVMSQLGTADAFACVERAFRLLSDGKAVNAPRLRSAIGSAVLNVMWAMAPSEGVMGVKSYPIVHEDTTQGVVLNLLVYSIDTGELLAMMKADRLGQLRTGAATAVASKALARGDAKNLAVYGTGFQAETQIKALTAAMPGLEVVNVVGRNENHRDSFIARMRDEVDVDIRKSDAEPAARSADIIVTATNSADPVVLGDWIAPGTHINAVGSNAPTKREVDRAVLEKAAVVVVDDLEVAAIDCGDLLVNEWDLGSVGTVGDLLTGRIPGRQSPEDITLFESQGIALQDIVCAGLVISRAAERGLGFRIG